MSTIKKSIRKALTTLSVVCALLFLAAGCGETKFINESNNGEDQTSTVKSATEVWDYPIKPGSVEWKTRSYDENVAKSQPPADMLKSWDTEMLLKYCADYPFNKVLLLYNNPNHGFKRVYDQATVWQEFIRRTDAVAVLSQYFEARPSKMLYEMTDDKVRRNDLFTLFFLEKLIAETEFTLFLDASRRRMLANVIFQRYQSKTEYPDQIYGYTYNSSLSAFIKILESDQVLSPESEISLEKFRAKTRNEAVADSGMESAIINMVMNYINQ